MSHKQRYTAVWEWISLWSRIIFWLLDSAGSKSSYLMHTSKFIINAFMWYTSPSLNVIMKVVSHREVSSAHFTVLFEVRGEFPFFYAKIKSLIKSMQQRLAFRKITHMPDTIAFDWNLIIIEWSTSFSKFSLFSLLIMNQVLLKWSLWHCHIDHL